MPQSAPVPARSRKAKALLAGGLVLGVGAAVTLASWTDEAYVEATFGTSSFNVQVTSDGGTAWEEADTPGTASALMFSLGFDTLEPGATVYAPVSLRTDPAGSVAGTVTLEGAAAGTGGDEALFDALRYTVTALEEDTRCAAGSVAGETLADGPLTTGSDPGAIALAADGGNQVDLCFAVSLPRDVDRNTALQGVSTSALWRFAASSDDA